MSLPRVRKSPTAFVVDEDAYEQWPPPKGLIERPIMLAAGRGDTRISRDEAIVLASELMRAVVVSVRPKEFQRIGTPATEPVEVLTSNNAAYEARRRREREGQPCCTRKIGDGKYGVFPLVPA